MKLSLCVKIKFKTETRMSLHINTPLCFFCTIKYQPKSKTKKCAKTIQNRHKAQINAIENNIVTEIYSPPRVNQFAEQHGLTAGHSIDITCEDEDGTPWDLGDKVKRNKLIKLVNKFR